MDSYIEECEPPIPIGRQKFAYQCENIVLEPMQGAIHIHAFIPNNGGKEPYPNPEKDKIEKYELEISRFTGNSIELTFTKHFKDKSEQTFLTNCSFSQIVNLLFSGHPANIWKKDAPINHFPNA